MTTPTWQATGQYFETCSCDFVCPCILGQMAVKPTQGTCTVAMAFKVDHGRYGDVPLDDLGFIVLVLTPEEMGKGNWSVGVITDERANDAQRDAITAIASGAAGGPMAVLSGLVGTFLGVASAPIHFERSGITWSVTAGKFVDMAAKGAMGLNPEATEPMHIDGAGLPANDRVGLYHALKSHVQALGLTWDSKGGNNGLQAPFGWSNS